MTLSSGCSALKTIAKALSLSLFLAFSLPDASYANRNLAPGLASPGGISSTEEDVALDGDGNVRDEMRGSAKLKMVMNDPLMRRGNVLDQTRPDFPEGLGIDTKSLYLTREEALDKVKNDPVASEMLSYGIDEIFTRCIEKASLNENGQVPEELPIDIVYTEFFLDDGELALPRILWDKRWEKPKLEIPLEFVVNAKRLLKNDICFLTEDGRVISLAQGILYRLARHEFKWRDHTGNFKKGGHLGFKERSSGQFEIDRREDAAYDISGRYSLINDAMMLWFVFAFHQDHNVYQNNENFKELIRRISYPNNKDPQAVAFRTYFPELARSPEKLEKAVQLACCINYQYFIKVLIDGKLPNGEISQEAILDVVNRHRIVREAIFHRVGRILHPTENPDFLDWEFRASGHEKTDAPDEKRASRNLAGVVKESFQFFPEDPRISYLSDEAAFDLNSYESKSRSVVSTTEKILREHYLDIPEGAVIPADAKPDKDKFTVLDLKSAENIYAASTGISSPVSPEEIADFFMGRAAAAVFIRLEQKEILVKAADNSIFGKATSFRLKALPIFENKDDTAGRKAFAEALAYGLSADWDASKSAMFAEISYGMALEGRKVLNTNGFIDALRYMDLHREYSLFMDSNPDSSPPEVKAFVSPSEEELSALERDFMKTDIDYYVHESLFAGNDLKYAEKLVREKLKGKIKTYSSLEDLALKLHSPSMAERSCIDLSGIDISPEKMEDFFLKNTQLRGARFLNSEYVDLEKLEESEKAGFIRLFLVRMNVIRSLEKIDVETENSSYRLACYFVHPYLPLGSDIRSYLGSMVELGTSDTGNFLRSLKNVVTTILRYRPIETYNIQEIEYVTKFLMSA